MSCLRLTSLCLLLWAGCMGLTRALDDTESQLAALLAGAVMTKEGGQNQQALNSLHIFQAVTKEDIHQKFLGGGKQEQQQEQPNLAQQAVEYLDKEVLAPAVAYEEQPLETKLKGLQPNTSEIFDAKKPDFSYFTDDSQSPLKDILKGLTRNGTSIGTVGGPDFINYAPCFISNQLSGVSLSAEAIDFIPQLVNSVPAGVSIIPAGVYIQPSLIFIAPQGVYASPTGVNVAPSLISIAPYGELINSAGVFVAPTGISVNTPPTGRRMLAEEGVASASAQDTISTDPAQFWKQNYEQWAGLYSKLAVGHSKTQADAEAFLSDIVGQASSLLKSPESLNLTSILPSGVTFTDPRFFNDLSSNVTSSSKGFSVASSFIRFAPCLISNTPQGVGVNAAAIEFNPSGLLLLPTGVKSQVSGVKLQPTIILVQPRGAQVIPSGVQIMPTLIQIAPAMHVISNRGVNVAPSIISTNAKTGKTQFFTNAG